MLDAVWKILCETVGFSMQYGRYCVRLWDSLGVQQGAPSSVQVRVIVLEEAVAKLKWEGQVRVI